MKVDKTPALTPQYAANPVGGEYYSTLAKEVYTAARRERWSSDRVQEMLKNPKNFRNYIKKVSLERARISFLAPCMRVTLVFSHNQGTAVHQS